MVDGGFFLGGEGGGGLNGEEEGRLGRDGKLGI